MALFYQHNINEATKLAIWRIEEEEAFFLERVPLKSDVTHPFKRLQHLAGRTLLPLLAEDFPLSEIVIADTRKPYLASEKYHFSISHSGSFAAAIVSSQSRVGVDIEKITPKIGSIQHKFLSEREYGMAVSNWQQAVPEIMALLPPTAPSPLLTLLWSAKEAIFKWYGLGQVDFREHIQLSGPIVSGTGGWLLLPFVFKKGGDTRLTVHGRFFEDLAFAWVLTG
ncbi:MAG: 4'-phosphopantetheinyl transferase superfamily protein [Puia sp.]|nr:4'-phosphopantetheinyl transferase superfamily protein [Puia sp.]